MTRARAAAALAAVAALVAGCGGHTTTRTVTSATTRVEVLRQAGAKDGGFDPGAIFRQESPGVVTIVSTGLRASNGREESGLGSGFVVSGNGEIVTNAHVVTSGEGPDIRKASDVFVRFADANQVPAQVVGFDPFADIALLKVDPAGLTLRPLRLGTTRDVRVGAPVAAIGSPFGEEQSLSVGVVSGLGRSIQSLTGFDTTGAIQTDAPINHGNSGGPLIDGSDRVVGVNAQIETTTGEGSGVGFAVPADVVRRSIDQLRRTGSAKYAFLGVSSVAVYPQLAQRFGLGTSTGAWVQEVTPGGPADDAGIHGGRGAAPFQDRTFGTGGDVVTALGGRPVRAEDDLSRLLLAYRPGDAVTLGILRGGERRSLRVKLSERPLDTPRGR